MVYSLGGNYLFRRRNFDGTPVSIVRREATTIITNMPRILLVSMMIASATLLGCAAKEPRSAIATETSESSPVHFETAARVPLLSQTGDLDDEHLVATDVRAGLGDDLVEIRSSYSMGSGALVQNLGAGFEQGQSIPTQLARQSLEHAFRLTMPNWLGAPMRIGYDQKEASVFTLNGQQRQESSRAHLSWNPEPMQLDVEWTPPRAMAAAGNSLDCMVEGRVRVPTEAASAGTVSALDVSHSDCLVRAPNRGVDELPLQSRGVSWRWGDGLGNSIHMNRVELQMPVTGMNELSAGYEVGMRQRHSFQGWQLEADVAVRQSNSVAQYRPDDDARWAVDLMLKRQLRQIALTARWMQSNDPLWFVPEATPIGRERLSLLLDFSSWLTDLMPGLDAGMSASWEHSEDAAGKDDNQLRWDFSLSW